MRDYCTARPSGGVTFPKGLPQTYANYSLWIGGIRAGDTLVSTLLDMPEYEDSTAVISEFFPAAPPGNEFVERTRRDHLLLGGGCGQLSFDEGARSEHDLIWVITDTIRDPNLVLANPHDHRGHEPLGLEVTTRSYAWSYDYAQDFVIVDYTIRNIGFRRHVTPDHEQELKSLYIGVLSWNFVHSFSVPLNAWIRGGGHDDICGRIVTAPLPHRPAVDGTLNLVWTIDNDGDPLGDIFDLYSVPSAVGVCVLAPPLQRKVFSSNWWLYWPPLSDPNWGPVRGGSHVSFSGGGLGYPFSDLAKYQMMTNGEIDYPQWSMALSHEGDGWLPPPVGASAYARGSNCWSLLSFGPYDLKLGDSVSFALAVVGGEGVHKDPKHFADSFDPLHPEGYAGGLSFDDLIRNAYWANWVYDSPGVDSDGDGFSGDFVISGLDTIFVVGDGIPDFAGPPPPPAPILMPSTRKGQVYLRWNGYRIETNRDPFTGRLDFEGYRVYMSRTGREGNWALLSQRDQLNFARYTWDPFKHRWDFRDPPFSLDSLRILYDELCDSTYGHPFHPDSFPGGTLDRAILEIHFDADHPERLDSAYRYFAPYEANECPDDQSLAWAVEAGVNVTGSIRRVFPNASASDTAYRDDGTPYLAHFEYEYSVRDLAVSEPVYFSVTAFDHGDPASQLSPLESSKSINATEVWPIHAASVVNSERPKPGVYPNPYRLADEYNSVGWENPRGLEPDAERARKVTFTNVPDTCTISIWSLDGDLVRKLVHAEDPGSSRATVVVWDLITRNTQAVKTGLYIYTVESRHGTDVGKLVIVK